MAIIAGSLAAAAIFCGLLRRAHQATQPAAVADVDTFDHVVQMDVNPIAQNQGVMGENVLADA